jgi:hypothetical protein
VGKPVYIPISRKFRPRWLGWHGNDQFHPESPFWDFMGTAGISPHFSGQTLPFAAIRIATCSSARHMSVKFLGFHGWRFEGNFTLYIVVTPP